MTMLRPPRMTLGLLVPVWATCLTFFVGVGALPMTASAHGVNERPVLSQPEHPAPADVPKSGQSRTGRTDLRRVPAPAPTSSFQRLLWSIAATPPGRQTPVDLLAGWLFNW